MSFGQVATFSSWERGWLIIWHVEVLHLQYSGAYVWCTWSSQNEIFPLLILCVTAMTNTSTLVFAAQSCPLNSGSRDAWYTYGQEHRSIMGHQSTYDWACHSLISYSQKAMGWEKAHDCIQLKMQWESNPSHGAVCWGEAKCVITFLTWHHAIKGNSALANEVLTNGIMVPHKKTH